MMNPQTLVITTYFVTMAAFLFLVNILTRGFIFTLIRVRASKGKKTIVKVIDADECYFAAVEVSEGETTIPSKTKKDDYKITELIRDDFYTALGVRWFDYDCINNRIIKPDGEGKNAIDPAKMEKLYVRAMNKPEVKSAGQHTKDKIKEIMLLIALAAMAYFIYKIYIRQGDIMGAIQALKSVGVVQ